jgi:HEAT repeat protein
MLNTISRILNIQRGEGRLLAPLLALSFCFGLARLFTQTASGTLFLVAFGVEFLPFVYISTAVIIPIIGLVYDRLSGQLALARLLMVTLGGLVAVILLLWASLALTSARWPAFALLVLDDVVWTMTSLCLWAMAGRLFDVQQGKRLFSLISAGDVLAALLGGLLTPILASLFGTANILLGTLAALLGGAVLVRYTTRRFAGALAESVEDEPVERRSGVASPLQRRYVVVILILVMISGAAFYFADNLLYGQVQARYADEAALAGFFAIFWATVNGLTLLSNLFLVSPLFGRYGVRGGLIVLPIITGIPAILLALGGTFYALPALVFWLVAAINLLDWVFRETIQKSSLLIVLQPLPLLIRLRWQARVESLGQPLAQGLAGLALVGIGLIAGGLLPIVYGLLALIAVSLILTLVVARDYVRVLLEALARRRLSGGGLVPADSDSAALLARAIDSPHPSAAIYALDMLESLRHASLADGLRRALVHPAPEVRIEALQRIERLQPRLLHEVRGAAGDPDPRVRGAAARALAALDEGALEQIAPLLDDGAPEVRLGAMVGLLRSGGVAGVLAAGGRLHSLAQSAAPADRIFAARALSEIGVTSFYQPLLPLIGDADRSVRRAAIAAAGKLKTLRLAPVLLAALATSDSPAEAASAAAACGEALLPELRAALARPDCTCATALRLLRVAGRIGGAQAQELLLTGLDTPDAQLRGAALLALNRCGYHAEPADRARIERALAAELGELARLLAAQIDLGDAPGGAPAETLRAPAIMEAVDQSRARLLLALACLYDPWTIGRARETLAHRSSEQRAFAIETLDTLLAQEHRPLIALLVDDQPAVARLRRLDPRMPLIGRERRLRAIAASPDGQYTSWLRDCARAAIGESFTLLDSSRNGVAMLTVIEKVLFLKTVSIFAGTPDSTLAEVAKLLEEQELAAGELLFAKGDAGRSMYIIVAGRVRVHDGDRVLNDLGESDIVGEMAVLDSAPRVASVSALEELLLLRLDQDALYELMSEHVEVARGIIQVLSGHLRARVADVAELRARVRELEQQPIS